MWVMTILNRITGRVIGFGRRYHAWLAAGMIGVMAMLAFGSMIGNSAIVDEVAHIPAGYSYVHYSDYRLNPEHPPLIKDLAGLPLQFLGLKFPDYEASWTTDVNGQWEAGWNFLYHIGNDPDWILFWARLPILVLMLAFGAVLYVIVRRRWGVAAALATLFLYALSPNFIAHGTLVTTDLGASVFIFLAIVAFGRFVNKPAGSNVVILGLALAGAELAKFSAILLYPFLGAVALCLVYLLRRPEGVPARAKTYLGGFIGASALSLGVIWAYYATQVARMPVEVQSRLISGSLPSDNMRPIANLLMHVNSLPLMKSLVQYLLGVTMVYGRVTGGNVTYFNGQVTNESFHAYFPELFALKTQIALLLLMLGLLVWLGWRVLRLPVRQWATALVENVRAHVLEWTLGVFALFYFGVSVAGNLNLGIRHVLPVYLPLFLLVALGTVKVLRSVKGKHLFGPAMAAVMALALWYGGSTVLAYPNYLSYFNESIGGQGNSGKYFSDSSVDWGQDLRRLVKYVKAHPEIHKIAVDYFGGGAPEYYFCARKYANGQLIATSAGYDCSDSQYVEWHAQYGQYTGQYIAVSETFLENDRYYAAKQNRAGYEYLRQREPKTIIGNSIYVYQLY